MEMNVAWKHDNYLRLIRNNSKTFTLFNDLAKSIQNTLLDKPNQLICFLINNWK